MARGVHRRAFLRDGVEDTRAAQRRAFASDGDPMVLAVEPFERRLAEALASSMAQQHQAVVISQIGWIVGEFESPDSPGLDTGASEQILTDQRAVVAGPGADKKDSRASGQSRDGRRRWRLPQESLQRVGLRLNGFFEKRAGGLQATSSQALRNWYTIRPVAPQMTSSPIV